MNEYERNELQELLYKIAVLLPYAGMNTEQELEQLRKKIKRDLSSGISVNNGLYYSKYSHLEEVVLDELTPRQRSDVLGGLAGIKGLYVRKNASRNSDLSDIAQLERLNNLENQVNRLIERPKLYEARAEEKLAGIDEKFRKLMNISDRNSSITDNIKKVDDLEKKLSKLEADAQNMMSDISTVELGKQYLEAKNRYCAPKPKMKFSRSKNRCIRYFSNAYYWLLWLFKRAFHTGFFLYTGFMLSLVVLTFSYLLIVLGNNDTYKDLALTIPMIWLAWFFQRKINTRDKLFELYNHKQKVMETYVAFKNSVYDFKASDKMEEVLLEAIKKDPSDCIGKDNTTLIETILDKLRGLFISGRVKKVIREDVIDGK
ncbi:MAG: hypothetical protein J6J35_02320 [Alphaproteobacteria bacterium]|nr:hypothetical protein [Alphaproteobacteria bacterium]